ncbi:MAG TPA: hypothetical protein VGI37_04350 [Streptosporangiaceae bacterium]|jgi:hypothetical protein
MSLDRLPGLAEPTMRPGHHSAQTIARRINDTDERRPFRSRDLGTMATISRFNEALRTFQAAAARALERALDVTEPDRAVISFLVHPVPGLLQRHLQRRTAHAALIAEILSLLTETSTALPVAEHHPARTCAASTTSPTSTAARRPSTGRAASACSHPQRDGL